MVNTWSILIISFGLLLSNYLSFGYGIRIGKAMQKEIPSVPLAEPVEKAVSMVKSISKKIGGRKIRLVNSIQDLKALKKDKDESGVFD